ncbi:hypothetical protein [Sunxiuqinia dokdonensis]|uniref:Uncharacterized protein n=1 Tax=Sunxiuqinia dokdonensis TaxID=1409788 RepID=A0A0L8VER4_9BACT|nr:hypothetical protein [Sunxiuqinia dokdonensis]KOH46970.1 hypothetical protein NC99_02090 [Sunxiuqinia dokdonensis]
MEDQLANNEDFNRLIPDDKLDEIVDKGLGGSPPPSAKTDQNPVDRGLGGSTPPTGDYSD